MSVAKITEIKASSPRGFEDAIKAGVARAHKTLKHITSAWIQDHEVIIDESGKISEYRVLMKITFILED